MRQATFVLVGALVLAGVSTVLSLRAEAQPAPEAPAGSSADAVVTVDNFQFEDQDTGTPVTHVDVGDTVRWVWTGGCHSVTDGVRSPYGQPIGPSAFDSGVQCTDYEEGEPVTTFSVTFDEPGVYKYYCKPHVQMEGLVIVGGAG
jgi:plastocyanin